MPTAFKKYDFVGLKNSASDKAKFQDMSLFFIRDITEDSITYDEYFGENLFKKHVIVNKLDPEVFEKKEIKAWFEITEFDNTTNEVYKNPKIFLTTDSIFPQKFQHWLISSVTILCDVDCKELVIDVDGGWPPKAA